VAPDGPGSCELDGTVDEEAFCPAWKAEGIASWWEELCSAVPNCERASDDVRSVFRPGTIGLCCMDMVEAENKGVGMQVARTTHFNKCASSCRLVEYHQLHYYADPISLLRMRHPDSAPNLRPLHVNLV